MNFPNRVQLEKALWFGTSSVGLYLTASCKKNKIHPFIVLVSATTGFVFSSWPIVCLIFHNSLRNFCLPKDTFVKQYIYKNFCSTPSTLNLKESIYKSLLVGFLDPVLRQLPVTKPFSVFKRIFLVKAAVAALAWLELGYMFGQTLSSAYVCKNSFFPRSPSTRGSSRNNQQKNERREDVSPNPLNPPRATFRKDQTAGAPLSSDGTASDSSSFNDYSTPSLTRKRASDEGGRSKIPSQEDLEALIQQVDQTKKVY